MEKAKQEYDTYVSDYFRRGAMREMPDNERQVIIDGKRPPEQRSSGSRDTHHSRFEEAMG